MKIGITTNDILIPKKLFKAKVEKDLEFDTPLADYYPDIARLIRVDCTPFAESAHIEGDKAIVNGRALYDVLYETDYKNKLKYCSFTQEFSQAVPMPRSSDSEGNVFCSVKCQRINCKLLSPRRLLIKSTLSTLFDVEGETAIKALAVKEDGETFFRKKTIGFNGKTAILEETFRFSDNLSLTQNEKSIGEIVCGNIVLQQPQISLSRGRAEIKTNAYIHALCEEESNEGNYYMAVKTLPVSIDYQNDSIEDFKKITAELTADDITLTPELDQYGESRMIKVDFATKLRLKVNEPKAYTVAEDMFEKGFENSFVSGSVTVPKGETYTETGFTVETKLPEMMPKPERLLDSLIDENSAIAERAEGGVNVSGNFVVTLLSDTAEGVHSFDHIIPYSQFIPLELPMAETEIEAEVYPIEVISTLHSDGSASLRIIAGAKIEASTQQEDFFIADVAKRTPIEADAEPSSLIYCYPHKGENLWSIAKSYRTDPEAIIKANPESFDEAGNTANSSKPILIKI